MNRKSKFNLAIRRTLHPVYRSLETTVHPLRYLFLEITQKCNLACLHCGSDCSKKPRAGELTTREWNDFIEYLGAKYKKRKDLFLVLTGGEPLCHPELKKILECIKGQAFPFGMVTNGYLLNPKTIAMLEEYGLSSITVSLDGLRASHDWLRGTKGSFHRATKGLALLNASPISQVDVVTCVHPRNLSELPSILELLQKMGVRQWRLFNIFAKGRAGTTPELLLTEAQLKEMFDWLKTTRRALATTDFHLDFSCEGYLPKAFDAEVRDEPYFCRAGICIGSVLCDGAISACPNITRALVQGNIRDDDFKAVWEHEFKSFRDRSWMKTGPCAQCSEWKRCNGNSLHLWDHGSGQTMLCYPKSLGLL